MMHFAFLTLILLFQTPYVSKGAPEKVYASWPYDSTVSVSIEPGFTDEQEVAIARAFDAWWGVAGVKFEFKHEGGGQITIKRQRMFVAAQSVMSTIDGQLVSAEILVGPSVKDADALQSTIAHEIGHLMGLSDCRDCKSVMTYKSKGVNQGNGYRAPTAIDLAALGRSQ